MTKPTAKPNIDHEGRVLTDLTPVEVDTLVAPIWGEIQKYRMRAYYAGIELRSLKKAGPGVAEFYQTQDDLDARHAAAVAKLEADIAEWKAEAAKFAALAAPYEAEWNRRPWRRYFLVTNSNGHVHRETDCSTCFPTTQYAWLIKLSGCDENAMVEEYGEMACTVCFPDAPTLPGWMVAKDRAEAAKAATECEYGGTYEYEQVGRYRGYGNCKCGAKGVALTPNGALRKHLTPEQAKAEADRKATFGHPDGKKLKDFLGQRVQKTPTGAFNALRACLRIEETLAADESDPTARSWYREYYGPALARNEKARLATALALYNGTTPEEEIRKAGDKNRLEDDKGQARGTARRR